MSPSQLSYCGIPIYTNRYLGEVVVPDPPPMKRGPYLQRRIKRWRQAHAYTRGKGQYFVVKDPILDGEAIWCHPDDLAKLRMALKGVPHAKSLDQWEGPAPSARGRSANATRW